MTQIIPKYGRIANQNERLENISITHAMEDSFRLLGSAALYRCTSRDLAPRNNNALIDKAHRDHAQIIKPPADGLYNQQYAGGEVSQVLIEECLFYSPDTQMQGIFMSDGFIRYGIFINNDIITASEHKITVCLLDGCIYGNRDATGQPVMVNLIGLRIGGGLPDRPRIKIMSFTGNDQYIAGDQIYHDDLNYLKDERTTFDDNTIHLDGFDLAAYRAAAAQVQSHDGCNPRGANAMCVDFWDLAQQYGTPVTRIY